jgi:hypothetical protein
MTVYLIRPFWFDDYYDNSGTVQRTYLTLDDFGIRNVAITAQLNVFSPAWHLHISDGKISGELGFAAVGIRWYETFDNTGFHHVDNSYFVPHAIIYNCVALQLELAFNRAWVGATGTILYFND